MAGMTALADLCDLVTETVNPLAMRGTTYVGLEHLIPGRLQRSGEGLAEDTVSAKHAFIAGDVLYGKLRPYLDKAVLVEDSGICTTELLVLRPKQGVNPRFLVSLLHLPSFIAHAVEGVTGVQHPRTSWNHIARYQLIAFDHAEMDAVARIAWSVHLAIVANLAALETAIDLKRAAMRRLFSCGLRGEVRKDSEIGPVPESWVAETLARRHSVVSGGTPSRSRSEYWVAGSIPWVKTSEINYRLITETEEAITPEALRDSAARELPAGTLLMAMYGQGVTRGKVAMLGIPATCNQACAAIRATESGVSPNFLYHYLAYRYDAIRALAHGGQQQNLSLEIVKGLPVVFPAESAEQDAISNILDVIDRKIDLHRRKREILDDLFKSLLQELMTGEIRVSDLDLDALTAVSRPAGEPA